MQLTLPFNKDIKKEKLELYPCASPHKEILSAIFSSLERNHLADTKKLDDHLTNALISILNSPKDKLEGLERVEGLSYLSEYSPQDISPLEELISIIFQTKPLRYNGKAHGDLIRKRKGIFHTPYNIAKIIAKEALLPHTNKIYKKISTTNNTALQKKLYSTLLSLKIIDPACGTGIILSAAIEYLCEINRSLHKILNKTNFYLSEKKFSDYIVSKCIFGVDIDPEACATTKAILMAKYVTSNRDLSNNIKCGDSILPTNLFNENSFSFQKDFSSIFPTQGGFDVLIMNPPYERLKIDKSDFTQISKPENIYHSHKQNNSNLVKIIKKSNEYLLSSQGVLDLYKLFIDKATQITNSTGTIAFIVPISLLGDKSCKNIREYLYQKTHIYNIYCIPENTKIFHNVSQAFCIMGLQKNITRKESTIIHKDVSSISPLTYSNKFAINKDDIKSICPETLSLPLTDEIGWTILKKIHKQKLLHRIDDIINLRGEVDLTFGAKYITDNPNDKPLIRGNAINTYSLNDTKNNKPSYIKIEVLNASSLISTKQKYVNTTRIVGQQISNMGLSKRLKFALVNEGFVANSCNFLTIKNNNKADLLVLLGLLNSALLNWRFKLTSTNNHVNNYELDELPIVTINQKNRQLCLRIEKLVGSQCKKYLPDRQQKIDLLIFKLYGLTNNENAYILQTL